jgi:hypothetical protein
MDADRAPAFVLTLRLGGCPDPQVADDVVRDLGHLNAVRGPSVPGEVLVHCTVSAPTEPDAVRYAANRAVTSLVEHGVVAPRVLDVEACALHALAV